MGEAVEFEVVEGEEGPQANVVRLQVNSYRVEYEISAEQEDGFLPSSCFRFYQV